MNILKSIKPALSSISHYYNLSFSSTLKVTSKLGKRALSKMSSLVIAPGIIFLVGVLLYHLFFRKTPEPLLPLPPGPDPLPILGNIRDGPPPGMPEYQHWLSFKDKYGPISSITVFGQTAVIIHDREAIIELLERASLKTSARPEFKFSTMCGYGRYLSLQQYNNQFRLHRKLVHQGIGTKALASQYTDIQDVESKRFLFRVLIDPLNLFRHIRTYG
jgi:hypothetical protein